MDFHKFEIFINLAETLNYTETAEQMYTTQGNISKQIIALEKDLGVKLFQRSHRQLTLTEVGEMTLPFAKTILHQYDTLQSTIEDFQEGKKQSLKIYTIPTMPNYHGFTKITQFLKKYPDIRIQLEESESYELFPLLAEGDNTIIFARTFEKSKENVEWITTERDHFVAILPKNHPLAARTEINLAELAEDKFILLGKDTNLFAPVMELAAEAGFKPHVIYEGHRIDLMLNMVKSELGIAVLMSKTAKSLLDDSLHVVKITPNKTSYLSFVRTKGGSSAASDIFWHYLAQTK